MLCIPHDAQWHDVSVTFWPSFHIITILDQDCIKENPVVLEVIALTMKNSIDGDIIIHMDGSVICNCMCFHSSVWREYEKGEEWHFCYDY